MTQSYTRALGLALVLAGALLPSVSRASPTGVQAGWDLFYTTYAAFDFGSGLGLQGFHGDPITSYDFGPGVGVQDLANSSGGYYTDTIVQRDAATFSSPTTIVLKDLSLVSDNAISGDLGGTAGHRVRTQVISSDPSSEITINADGTFSSLLTFDFSLLDAITYQVLVADIQQTLTANGNWSPNPGSRLLIPLIDGVNVNLSPPCPLDTPKEDCPVDFFTVGKTVHDATGADHHTVSQTPLPGTIWLVGPALAGLRLFGKRRSSQGPA